MNDRLACIDEMAVDHGKSLAHVAPEEPLAHVAYLHDGTLEGLMCAIFMAYQRHEQPEDIQDERSYQPRLMQSALYVSTDYERALRVRRGIEREAGSAAFGAVVRAAAADDPQAGMVVYRFVRYVMDRSVKRDQKRSVLSDLANPIIDDLVRLEHRTSCEAERMRQFIRFSHCEGGLWFARCNPTCSVVPLVMRYFVARFNTQPFIIYDENHHLAGIYNGNDWQLVDGEATDVPIPTADDAYQQALWQRFYDSLTIEARYNPELRRHFMPVRLWKNLPEMLPRASRMLSTRG